MLSFGNPLGLLALVAVPAILAIHFLQRESRRVVTSTLFLLEPLAPESAQGRRWERLRNSVPLWLQLLAVLLITWLLVEPRWLRPHSTQRVAVVLDSSVSMGAFRAEMLRELDRQTARLARAAAKTEWHLVESDTTRPTLYAGSDRAALLAAAGKWQPHLGAHDFAPALCAVQAVLHGSGTAMLVSDREVAVPEGVRLVAVGRVLENCGFAGVTMNGAEWRVLVRNYGRAVQRRQWSIFANGQNSPAEELVLEPGQSVVLQGSIPAGAEQCELQLTGDDFPLDDRLPLVRPEPKRLQVAAPAEGPFAEFFAQFLQSVEAVERGGGGKVDVQLSVLPAGAGELPAGSGIVFVHDPAAGKKLRAGNVVAENHPLQVEANWSGLLCRESGGIAPAPGDETLVWQGEQRLIFLRENGGASQLVVNFDLSASNATRLPAFVLLLHRFVEQVRAGKVAAEARNVETNQLLEVAADAALPPPTIGDEPAGVLRAPAAPGFFEVRQGSAVLLRGAAHFADAREADFRDAAAIDGMGDAAARLVEQNSAADFLAPVWTLLLGVVAIGSWIWRQR